VKVLLDTHVWIWSITQPERLRSDIRDLIESGEDTLWLSPVSVWETVMLIERGQLGIAIDPREWLDLALHEYPTREAPLTHAIAIESRFVELPHRDPADRFLAATAKVHGLRLATHDRVLLAAPSIDTV
jgi:PIN domain nuclease of toxin-antitoxin system